MRVAGTPLRDYGLSAALLVIAILYTSSSSRFGAASRAVPQLIGAAAIVLCLCDLVSRSDTAAGRLLCRWLNPAGRTEAGRPRLGRQAVALGGLAVGTLTMVFVGLLVPVAGLCLLSFRFGASQSWLRSALLACCMAGLIWALFDLALGLQLYPGLMFGGEA